MESEREAMVFTYTMGEASDMSIKSDDKDVDSISDGNTDGKEEEMISSIIEEKIQDIETVFPEIKNTISQNLAEAISVRHLITPNDLPQSYQENSKKEKSILKMVDNFRKQYSQLYRERKPLFLNPVNECGIEKFVCTTIRPNLLPFQELYDWQDCSNFISDYLTIKPLDPPFELPKCLPSPTSILAYQIGNSFDHSAVLCCLLLGAGYDAYVVSGYAKREICEMDETRKDCPFLIPKVVAAPPAKAISQSKYAMQSPKMMLSRFELGMERKAYAIQKALEMEKEMQERLKILQAEKYPTDPLHGYRVHCWIVVLPGQRGITEPFFIEPFTGEGHSIDYESFLGIESLWNNVNYWVNMQTCSLENIIFDLDNLAHWEFVFPVYKWIIPENIGKKSKDLKSEDDDDEEFDKHKKCIDLPPSWIHSFNLSLQEFEKRYPGGKKRRVYKRVVEEKFSPYLMPDGLSKKITKYYDMECTQSLSIEEYFSNRSDQLISRHCDETSEWITEHFAPNRPDALKAHKYRDAIITLESEQTLEFYDEARVDGLMKREILATDEMIEHFTGRPDFLLFKHVTYCKGVKFKDENEPKPVGKIIERFDRDPNCLADKNVAERIFDISARKIHIVYHYNDDQISPASRVIHLPHLGKKKDFLIMHPNVVSVFHPSPYVSPPKDLELYKQMVFLEEESEKSIAAIRDSELWTRRVLNQRAKEEGRIELEIQMFDTQRNEKSKMRREELERLEEEERYRKEHMEEDYLAPYLHQLGYPTEFSVQQAYQLKKMCLDDLKQKIVFDANQLQARFQESTRELEKRQKVFLETYTTLTEDELKVIHHDCYEIFFSIHIIELRLKRVKDSAPRKYKTLERKLRTDPRLTVHFQNVF